MQHPAGPERGRPAAYPARPAVDVSPSRYDVPIAGHSVICSKCSSRFSVPYEIGLWSCPLCRTANEGAASADKVVTSPAAHVREKSVSKQLAEALGRLTGRKSLYGYADKLIDVPCPECQTGITMTNNVRTARCVKCEAVVQRT